MASFSSIAAAALVLAGSAVLPAPTSTLVARANSDCSEAAAEVVAKTGGQLLSAQPSGDSCIVTVLVQGNGQRPRKVTMKVPTRESGDAHARQQVRIAEAHMSIQLIQHAIDTLPDGPIRAPCAPAPNSEGLGWAESPRGSLYYAVHLDGNGRLARVKIKSPSYSNWRVFGFTVHDSNMMDYAINEASFGLTMAGCDR